MRETTSGAWTWWPAELLVLNLKQDAVSPDGDIRRPDRFHIDIPLLYDVAVVQWWKNGRSYMDIFPLNRIRYRTPLNWWATVGQSVPAAYLSQGTGLASHRPCYRGPRSLDEWKFAKRCNWKKDELHPVCVEVANGHLSYILRQFKKARESRFLAAWERFEGELTTDLPWIIAAAVPHPIQVLGDVSVLPVELCLEVFSCLDTQKQTELRAVCAAWDAVLQNVVDWPIR
ncbi:uncharacterized protein LOC129601666 [Paramacrobiotus metropolitanus]|uniref:uncharacterized protein LOC129601666 n=1 Tax=Paramacrobiotus metropolitanus TaxID=2943436 RepID=UPI002445E9C1|nr:uncharacterized protein LOC129601666 [Paramacrobiotus metropolitanus]